MMLQPFWLIAYISFKIHGGLWLYECCDMRMQGGTGFSPAALAVINRQKMVKFFGFYWHRNDDWAIVGNWAEKN